MVLMVVAVKVQAKPANMVGTTLFGWTATSTPVDPNRQAKVTIAITHPKGAKERLHQAFTDVSYGGSRYTQYLSRDEVAKMMAPSQESIDKVLMWCTTNDLECSVTGTGDMIRAAGKVTNLESALETKLYSFDHPKANRPIVRSATPVKIPSSLQGHIEVINGLDSFPTIFVQSGKVAGVNEGAPEVTPSLLKGSTLYNITDVAESDSKSSMAVAEFQGQGFLPSDLTAFETGTGLPQQAVRRVLGGNPMADKVAMTEASLDIQYIIATGTGVPADFWLEKSDAFDLYGWASEVLNESTPALVWSVSYGEGVNGGIGGVIPVETVHRLNSEMEKFGVLGMTVFVASGDSGVYSRKPIHTEFHVSYPACLPAVTSVGATQLQSDGSETTAVSFSGGGFTPANYYTSSADSPWQNKSIAGYLASGVKLPPANDWDRTGRGVPDVSAVGVDYKIWTQGHAGGVSGTSASTPAVAGIFALINDKLMAAGKRPMGFVNPFIYANPQGFRDILLGYNDGGGLNLFKHGFYATKGWDPLTGMGTPNYPALKAAAMAAQTMSQPKPLPYTLY